MTTKITDVNSEQSAIVAKRDQDVLEHLISTYGAALDLDGLSKARQADILHELSERTGLKVARGSIVAIRNGTVHKGRRHMDTYEGITLIFAAVDSRLIQEGRSQQNCFLMSLTDLQELARTYPRAARNSAALDAGLARMRNLRSNRARNTNSISWPIQSDQSAPQRAESGSYANVIFANWLKPEHSGSENIIPGFYQIFRIYKPTREFPAIKGLTGERKQQEFAQEQGSSIGNYGGPDLQDHVVICELIWVDAVNMECIVVTSQRNTYIGTLHMNHEDILFAILQRKVGSASKINQRFICMEVIRSDLAYHSGLMIKVGDTTGRPLASECLFVRIRRRFAAHHDLYQEVEMLQGAAANGKRVPRTSVMARYITPNPPAFSFYDPTALEWKDVKFVREFPALHNLSKMQGSAKNKFRFLREPLRTLDGDVLTILGREKEMALPPYRRQDP